MSILYRDLRGAERSDFFEATIAAFGRELEHFFPNREIPASQIFRDDDIASMYRADKSIRPPVFTYKISSVSLARDKFNPTSLRRHGIVVNRQRETLVNEPGDMERPTDPQAQYTKLHLQPCRVTLTVNLVADYNEAYLFAQLWLEAALARYLDFEIKYEDYSFRIRVELSEDVSFPSIGDGENQNIVIMQTEATLHTYHGVEMQVKPIRRYNVTGKLVGNDRDNDGYRDAHDIFRIENDVGESTRFEVGEV